MQNRLQRKIEREKGDYKMKEKILDIIEKVCEDDSIREDLTMNLLQRIYWIP